jgi:response regulator of citrate/malate metabolism
VNAIVEWAGAAAVSCSVVNAASNMPKKPKGKAEKFVGSRLSPTLLLLSADEMLADLVRGVVKPPWQIAHPNLETAHPHPEKSQLLSFSPPNVRLVIVDDQAIEDYHLDKLLVKIRKQFSGAPLLYVADRQSDDNERRARSNGAHYYISKPLPTERFAQVLTSFLRVEQIKG